MLEPEEIKALIHLLDDDDNDIINHVEQKLLSFGTDVLPYLHHGKLVESELVVQKIDVIIDKISFHSIASELKNWKNHNADNLLEGITIINKIKEPLITSQYLSNILDTIKLDVWLELNYNLTSFEKVRILNYVFFENLKFIGDNENYHDPENSFISSVLQRRKGNPISLAIIYILVAQRLNIPIFGINLPQHFIVAYLYYENDEDSTFYNEVKEIKIPDNPEVMFYINPFNKGSLFPKENLMSFLTQLNIESKKEYYLPCTNIEIIKRVLRNLFSSYEKLNQSKKMNLIQELMKTLEK